MSYSECKKIALLLNYNVNSCREYKDAYYFFDNESNADGDDGVVVIKETGKAISFINFILNYSPEKNPKNIEF